MKRGSTRGYLVSCPRLIEVLIIDTGNTERVFSACAYAEYFRVSLSDKGKVQNSLYGMILFIVKQKKN